MRGDEEIRREGAARCGREKSDQHLAEGRGSSRGGRGSRWDVLCLLNDTLKDTTTPDTRTLG